MDAAGIIGSGSPGEDGLSPVEHAEQLRSSAPKLAALLTRSGPVELARQYAEADTEALAAERTFKRWVSRANRAVLGTATVSALLMAVALLADRLDGLARTALIVLALAGVAAGGIASMSLFRVKEGRLLEDWMTARARAETKRLSYFNYIVNSSVQPLDLELELLKLEYFRRYQLDLQLAYYKTRRSGHRKSAERTLSISAGAVLVAAIASGAAGVLGAQNSEWAALGSLAVFGAALQAFAASRESINQDRRKPSVMTTQLRHCKAYASASTRCDSASPPDSRQCSVNTSPPYRTSCRSNIGNGWRERRICGQPWPGWRRRSAAGPRSPTPPPTKKVPLARTEGADARTDARSPRRQWACNPGDQVIVWPARLRTRWVCRSAPCRCRPTSPSPRPVPH